MSSCKKCKSANVIYIQAHARDCFYVRYFNGAEHDGYFPEDLEKLGRGDDMEIHICLSCGTVQELIENDS